MTKRKRDLLTVVEEINSWFKTSGNLIAPETNPEGSLSHLASEGATTNCDVPAPGSVGEAVRWKELDHVAAGNDQLERGSEVAGTCTIYPAGEPRVSGGTEEVTGQDASKGGGFGLIMYVQYEHLWCGWLGTKIPK